MQDFYFKQLENYSYCVVGYEGDEENIVIPGSYLGYPVTVISDGIFSGHPEITSVEIPETVTDIGEFVFDGCVNLRHIDLPQSVTALWGHTFTRSGIEEITLPEGLVTIPPYAFKECKNLRKVICGSNLKKIYAWAFAGCDSLKEVIYGPGTEVSPRAFSYKE